jgi:hypothetical protein
LAANINIKEDPRRYHSTNVKAVYKLYMDGISIATKLQLALKCGKGLCIEVAESWADGVFRRSLILSATTDRALRGRFLYLRRARQFRII